VQEITNQARQQILQAIKALCSEINEKRGDELRKLCADYACKMWLVIDEGNNNPFMIRPILYVFFEGNDSPAKKLSWQKLTGEISGWASNNRLTLKMLEEPYQQTTAEYTYP